MPQIFPETPQVCFFRLPDPIYVPTNRAFEAADFRKSINYRGAMNNLIYLACELEFKNIVLLGADLKTGEYFYDHYECMQWLHRLKNAIHAPLEERKRYPYGHDHIPTMGKYKHSIETFCYALNDLVLKPKGINLYVGSTETLLYPRIPLYQWQNG